MIEVREYDNSETYSKGQYCIYNNSLQKANQDIDTAEDFDSSHWDATSVMNEIDELITSNKYSSTENKIGTWIDGKPLYRRVYVTTAPRVVNDGTFTTGYITDGVRLSTIDHINVYGTAIIGTAFWPMPYFTNSGRVIKVFYNAGADNLGAINIVSSGTAYNNAQCVIIAEYTKKTD